MRSSSSSHGATASGRGLIACIMTVCLAILLHMTAKDTAFLLQLQENMDFSEKLTASIAVFHSFSFYLEASPCHARACICACVHVCIVMLLYRKLGSQLYNKCLRN